MRKSDNEDIAATVREIFAEHSFRFVTDESGVSPDDSLYLVGSVKSRGIWESDRRIKEHEREVEEWLSRYDPDIRKLKAAKLVEKIIQKRNREYRLLKAKKHRLEKDFSRNQRELKRRVRAIHSEWKELKKNYRQARGNLLLQWDATRHAAYRKRLEVRPTVWGIERDRCIQLALGESVDLPVPEGRETREYVIALRVNLRIGKTQMRRFTVKTSGERTVTVTFIEQMYSAYERLEQQNVLVKAG